MVKAMCGVQLKDRRRSMDLMFFLLGLKETIDQLAMTNSVWSCVEERGYHVLRRAFDFEVEVKGRKGGQKGCGKSRLRKKVYRLI